MAVDTSNLKKNDLVQATGYGSDWYRVQQTGSSLGADIMVLRRADGTGDDLYVSKKSVTAIRDSSTVSTSENNLYNDVATAVANTTVVDTSEATSKVIDVLQSEISTLFENSTVNGNVGLTATTRLFGIPYQFTNTVDPRIPNISSLLGAEYCRNIIAEAPILTIMPGKPKYLGSNSNIKDQLTSSLINNGGNAMNSLAGLMGASGSQIVSNHQLRYYDFECDYTSYIKYVNLMCRVAAGFLGIESKVIDGVKLSEYSWQNYRFNGGRYITAAQSIVDLGLAKFSEITDAAFDWSKQKWSQIQKYLTSLDAVGLDEAVGNANTNKKQYSMNTSVTSAVSNHNEPDVTPVNISDEVSAGQDFWGDMVAAASVNMDYVQFYIDPTQFNESTSNNTQASMIDGLINTQGGSNALKELQFILGSAGADDKDLVGAVSTFTENSAQSLLSVLNSATSNQSALSVVNRIGNIGANVIKGETMIFPEIYMRSDYSKSYNVSISLKTPYGDKYSYYMNILVPLFHLIALAAPRQSTANTYTSPFIVKCTIPGIVNCTLGIVESVNISKNPSGDGLSVDGYPLEVTVSLVIKDLYADLMISPTSSATLFLTNSGLIDYLAINCGLDVTSPNYAAKIKTFVNTMISSAKDIPQNAGEEIWNNVQSGIFNDSQWF